MYPQVEIDLDKLRKNLDTICNLVVERGNSSLMIVTKCICADEKIVDIILDEPRVSYLADSRIDNIKTYAKKAREAGKKTALLRIPMVDELEDVVKFVDLTFISHMETAIALDEEAKKLNLTKDVLLMVDLGDLREGIFFENKEELDDFAACITNLENLNLVGVGVNLTCYGAIIPKKHTLENLVETKKYLEDNYGFNLHIVSGGNSSSLHLIEKGELPSSINNLRVGEGFLLGNETAYGERIEGTYKDAFTLECQLVELRVKPSLPIGEVGRDAFGNVPYYEDKGNMKRGIIAIGKQDVDLDGMTPLDDNIEIMGGSSDHIILDLNSTSKKYKIGDVVKFTLDYGALLKVMTSPYVKEKYKEKQ